MNRLNWLLLLSLVICAVWHIILWFVPVDGLTGTADFQAGQFHLRYTAPPDSTWSENGISLYSTILRVDAHNINEWVSQPDINRNVWDVGSLHQYLVERRDSDGKRVINTSLQRLSPGYFIGYPTVAILSTLIYLIIVLAIIRQYPTLPVVQPLVILTVGQLVGLSWITFGVSFSYIALGWPFSVQLALYVISNVLSFGAAVHLALTFVSPIAWFVRYRRLMLSSIYGLYPVGLIVCLFASPALPQRITNGWIWGNQASIALKGIAFVFWAMQYRRATVSQRSQLHWVLAALAAYDIPYLVSTISGIESLFVPQLWLSMLPPLGYALAILPGRRLRFRLGATTGFIHGIANTLIAALFLSGLGLAANILSTDRQRDNFSVVTILLAVVFALTTIPLINLLREQLDSWFNGTRSVQRALLHQFTGKVSDQIALDTVTRSFQETLEQAVQPAYAALWLWDRDVDVLRSVGLSDTAVPPIIMLDDNTRIYLSNLTVFTPEAHLHFWHEGAHYLGAISLLSSGELVGVCAIGPRIDGGNYTNDTLRFLETLTRSATLAFRNAQLIAQLEDKIAALRVAYQQLITVQESERQNLAAELHDETLQQLAHAHLITAQLHTAMNNTMPNIPNALHTLQQTLTTSERRLREIVRGIHPAVLTDLGLETALKSWLPRTKGVSFTFTSDFAGRRLSDPSLEMTLYRLAQEAVNNALKHAQASNIKVLLGWQNDVVQIEVIDDGVGFSPAALSMQSQRRNHFGLLNLRERVNAFGGTLEISSQPGKGAAIRACLPVTRTTKETVK